LCPTTERDLADGIGDASALLQAGAGLAVGSDSQSVIDLFEEARSIELDQRLASGERGHHSPAALLDAATTGGYRSLGWSEEGVGIAVGAPADLTTIRTDSPRLAGIPDVDMIAAVVFAAGAADVSTVVVGGRIIVEDGRHVRFDVVSELKEALR